MESGQPSGDVLAAIAAAMPDSFKQAIRDDFKDDPYAALLDDERTFAKLWEVFTPQDKQHYAALAGLDPAALEKLSRDISALAGTEGGAKKPFNARAHEDEADRAIYEPSAAPGEDREPFSAHIAGTIDPADETEEQARARRKKYLEALQALDAEEAKRKEEAQADGNKADKGGAEKNEIPQETDPERFSSNYLHLYRIRDHGHYLTLQGKGDRGPPHGHRAITEQQMRMALLTAILDKGMTDIQIYRGHKIDSQLTGLARNLLAGDPFLQKVLGNKAATPVLTQMQKDPPPWCKSDLGRWLHARHYNAQERRNVAGEKQSMKEGRKISGNFTNTAGRTLHDRVNRPEPPPAAAPSSSAPHA